MNKIVLEKVLLWLRAKPLSYKIALTLFLAGVILSVVTHVRSVEQQEEEAIVQPLHAAKPEFVRGIHLTCWVAGSAHARKRISELLKATELNSVVIAVKEYEGDVYIPGVPAVNKNKLYVDAIPDIQAYLAALKREGVYTIARVVVFKDKRLSQKRPDMAVKRPDGTIWTDRKGNSWLDPYNHEVWEYIFSIATRCVDLGFQEIQFDYIRYPSDGDIKLCRYSYAHHTSSSAARNLHEFLEAASRRIKPLGANLSIDVFGLTPSVEGDMGIGQKIVQMTASVDFVSPMLYPSHFAKGEYGIPNPDREPYMTVHKTMTDAKRRLGEDYVRLRPYLQDFSMGSHYGPVEVRAQIMACEQQGIKEWLLWNPNSQFTRAALRSKDGVLDDAAKVPASLLNTVEDMRRAAAHVKKSSPTELQVPENQVK